jgi:hypothetical protein
MCDVAAYRWGHCSHCGHEDAADQQRGPTSSWPTEEAKRTGLRGVAAARRQLDPLNFPLDDTHRVAHSETQANTGEEE